MPPARWNVKFYPRPFGPHDFRAALRRAPVILHLTGRRAPGLSDYFRTRYDDNAIWTHAQLEDKSGLDQISEACDGVLSELR